MTYNKPTLTICIVLCIIIATIQCSPSSDSMPDASDGDTSTLVMLSPEKGSENISVNSEFIWEKTNGTSEYEIELSNQESFSSTIASLSVDTNRVAINGLPHDSNIYWRVRKVNADQPQESWSQISHFKTEKGSENSLPIAASLQSPVNTSPNESLETNLEWTYVVNATNYQLQIAKDENFENIVLEESTTKTTFSVPDLELGQTYYWRVLANIQGKESTWSDTWNYSINSVSSSAIELIYPHDDSNDEASNLTFVWQQLEGVSSYNIQIATDESFENPVINEVTADTSFKASQLDVEKNYFWRIRKAAGNAGNSGHSQDSYATSAKAQNNIGSWSSTWSFQTSRNAKPRVQLSLPANYSTNLSTNLSFRWDKIDGASEYRIMVATDESFKNPEYDETVSKTNYKIKNLESNQTYYWGVQAAGSDKWSDTWIFKTGQEGAVPAVTLSSPDNNSSNLSTNLTFKWKKIDGVSNYHVMVATDNSFSDPEYDKNVSKTSYTIDNLDPNETYYWGVKAAGSDQWSDTWIFETGNGGTDNDGGGNNGGDGGSIPPVTLAAPENNSSDLSTELTFEWVEIDGVSEYQVMVATDNSFSNPEYDETVSETSYTIEDLENNETYYWGVRAAGSNPWSDTWSFSTGEETTEIPPIELSEPLNNEDDIPTNLTLEWEEVNQVDEYHVQVAINNSFSNSSLVEDEIVEDPNLEINDLSYDETYYWRVMADEGTEWSNIWNFTTEENSTNPPPTPPSMDGIVGVSNSNFVIDGQTFRFAGTNAYYLANYEKLDPQFVTSTLDAFEDAGITVVRMWGFYDGFDCGYSAQDSNENVIQTAPGQYSEEALRDLDNVIAKGKERGIRFLLPFVNYWDELGGVCQYNTWAGASNPSTNMSYFINSNSAQQWFRDYISMLLNRVNTVTGVAYKNEPAIFGWEIMNEGRNTGGDPAVLRDWYREIAQYIKSIDSNHVLATGEEGFDEGTPSQYSAGQYSNTYVLRAGEGTSYVMNTAIPEIDFGSAHWYPADWGLGSSFGQSLVNAQHAWLNDHKQIAGNLGKPLVLGEYGYAGWGNQEVLNIYNDMWDYAEQINLDGSFLWQFTTDYVKCYEFGGNICWPAGRQDANLYNSFEDHIQNIQQ